MHLKNFLLKEVEPGNRKYPLSKAYDIFRESMHNKGIINLPDRDKI